MGMLRNLYGSALPARMQLDKQILSRYMQSAPHAQCPACLRWPCHVLTGAVHEQGGQAAWVVNLPAGVAVDDRGAGHIWLRCIPRHAGAQREPWCRPALHNGDAAQHWHTARNACNIVMRWLGLHVASCPGSQVMHALLLPDHGVPADVAAACKSQSLEGFPSASTQTCAWCTALLQCCAPRGHIGKNLACQHGGARSLESKCNSFCPIYIEHCYKISSCCSVHSATHNGLHSTRMAFSDRRAAEKPPATHYYLFALVHGHGLV